MIFVLQLELQLVETERLLALELAYSLVASFDLFLAFSFIIGVKG